MKIKRDSLLHAETSALLTIGFGRVLPWWGAAIVAFSVGIGKEIWDKHHGGVPSWSDLAWDILGVLVGTAFNLIW